MEPAKTIITALGGARAVSELLGIHRSAVWKWSQPKEKGGTGGVIPIHHIPLLLHECGQRGLEVGAGDFLPQGDFLTRGSEQAGSLEVVHADS